MADISASEVVISLVMIAFVVFLFFWAHSLDEHRYGNFVASLLRKRRIIYLVFVLFVFSPLVSFVHDRLEEAYSLFVLSLLISVWLWIAFSKWRVKPLPGDVLYTFAKEQTYPKSISVILFGVGFVFTGLLVQSAERPFLLALFPFLCLAGAIYLLASNPVIQISNHALRNLGRDVYWQDVKIWLWTERKWEHQWLVIQKKGFASDLRFEFVKFPVAEVEKVDAILQTVAPNLAMTPKVA